LLNSAAGTMQVGCGSDGTGSGVIKRLRVPTEMTQILAMTSWRCMMFVLLQQSRAITRDNDAFLASSDLVSLEASVAE
jgi:hypothetical protein